MLTLIRRKYYSTEKSSVAQITIQAAEVAPASLVYQFAIYQTMLVVVIVAGRSLPASPEP